MTSDVLAKIRGKAETAKDNGKEAPPRKLCLVASKGSLDMAYPPLILANAARMSGIEVDLFFTFWGLDIINKKKNGEGQYLHGWESGFLHGTVRSLVQDPNLVGSDPWDVSGGDMDDA